MKKFLSKLPVMIVMLVLAVAVLGLYIGMLARPISYGMTYSGTFPSDSTNPNSESVETSLKFINSKKLEMSGMITGTQATVQMWYIKDGNTIVILPGIVGNETQNTENGDYYITEQEYEEFVKQYNALSQEEKDLLKAEGLNVTAFKVGDGVQDLTCTGAIVFAIIMGVVEVALIVFATISTIFFVIEKKKPQVQETTM